MGSEKQKAGHEWDWIARRIKSEHDKHSRLGDEWYKIAAAKIHSQFKDTEEKPKAQYQKELETFKVGYKRQFELRIRKRLVTFDGRVLDLCLPSSPSVLRNIIGQGYDDEGLVTCDYRDLDAIVTWATRQIVEMSKKHFAEWLKEETDKHDN